MIIIFHFFQGFVFVLLDQGLGFRVLGFCYFSLGFQGFAIFLQGSGFSIFRQGLGLVILDQGLGQCDFGLGFRVSVFGLGFRVFDFSLGFQGFSNFRQGSEGQKIKAHNDTSARANTKLNTKNYLLGKAQVGIFRLTVSFSNLNF